LHEPQPTRGFLIQRGAYLVNLVIEQRLRLIENVSRLLGDAFAGAQFVDLRREFERNVEEPASSCAADGPLRSSQGQLRLFDQSGCEPFTPRYGRILELALAGIGAA